MSTYKVHEDYQKLRISIPFYAAVLPLLQRMTRFNYDRQTICSTIDYHKQMISPCEGSEISIELFSPQEIEERSPCLLYLHGGAFALPATDFHKKLMVAYALGCSCKVVFVDYRLVPKYRYPYGLNDCFATYEWVFEHAEELGIDNRKIAICGDSAGGALAAGVTHRIRDELHHKLLFQMLIYPVLDARLQTHSMKIFTDTPIWNAKLTKKMWQLYLPENKEALSIAYASPNEATAFTDLPTAYIEVNEFDCLRDEAIEYAEKLQQNGVDTRLIQTEGTIHGFEMRYESPYTQKIIRQRIEFMKQQFA